MDQNSIDQAAMIMRRYRRRQAHVLSPAERLSLFSALQKRCMASLAANPTAVAAFHRRNHHLRRDASVRQLEAAMKHSAE